MTMLTKTFIEEQLNDWVFFIIIFIETFKTKVHDENNKQNVHKNIS